MWKGSSSLCHVDLKTGHFFAWRVFFLSFLAEFGAVSHGLPRRGRVASFLFVLEFGLGFLHVSRSASAPSYTGSPKQLALQLALLRVP